MSHSSLLTAICIPHDGSPWYRFQISDTFHMGMPLESAFPACVLDVCGEGDLTNLIGYTAEYEDEWITLNFLGWETEDPPLSRHRHLPVEFMEIPVYGNLFIVASREETPISITRSIYDTLMNQLEFLDDEEDL